MAFVQFQKLTLLIDIYSITHIKNKILNIYIMTVNIQRAQ
jgi:hypothetical protein